MLDHTNHYATANSQPSTIINQQPPSENITNEQILMIIAVLLAINAVSLVAVSALLFLAWRQWQVTTQGAEFGAASGLELVGHGQHGDLAIQKASAAK